MGWVEHVAPREEGKGVCRVLVGSLRESYHLEDPGLGGSIILSWILRTWDGSMDWIDLAQDRDRWRALVNAERNLRVP